MPCNSKLGAHRLDQFREKVHFELEKEFTEWFDYQPLLAFFSRLVSANDEARQAFIDARGLAIPFRAYLEHKLNYAEIFLWENTLLSLSHHHEAYSYPLRVFLPKKWCHHWRLMMVRIRERRTIWRQSDLAHVWTRLKSWDWIIPPISDSVGNTPESNIPLTDIFDFFLDLSEFLW
jgi:hypothetical protein